jgi:hypothetical protein
MRYEPESTAIIMKNAVLRWKRARKALEKGEQPYADRLIAMIERHLDDRIPPFEDPLEAVVFVVLLEMEKNWRHLHPQGGDGTQQVLPV